MVRTSVFCVVLAASGCAGRAIDKSFHNSRDNASVGLRGTDPSRPISGALETEDVADGKIQIRGEITGLDAGSYTLHLHRAEGCPPAGDAHDAANHKAELGTVVAPGGAPVRVDMKVAQSIKGDESISQYCIVVATADGAKAVASGAASTGSYFNAH